MSMKKTKPVHCAHCDTIFTKSIISIENDRKLSRQHFCSLSCVNDYNIVLVESIEKELKAYKYILSTVITNPEKISSSNDIDILYLKTIWDNQGGKCVYSNALLVLPSEVINKETEDVLYIAVINKIDPLMGYVKGNIQFISIVMSYIKRDLSHDKTLELVKLIRTS